MLGSPTSPALHEIVSNGLTSFLSPISLGNSSDERYLETNPAILRAI
jgi:hypothetical protein